MVRNARGTGRPDGEGQSPPRIRLSRRVALETELTKLFKVDAIDWNKQIVLGVIGEGFDSLNTDGKVLTATFVPYKEPPGRGVPRTPKFLVLIERFEGEVKFVKKK